MRSPHTPDEDDDEIPEYDGPSKSQRKRDAEAMKELGEALAQLPPTELDALPLSETLRDALDLARRITAHGAAARHRARLGKLLRHADVTEIRAALDERALARKLEAREFHRIEAWRDRLIAEGEPALDALAATLPELDLGRLRALIATAQRGDRGPAAAGAARELFRLLRSALAEAGPSA